MIIHSPIFSGSISQASSAYANLSGSFTGSFKGTIDVQQATFTNLIVANRLAVSGSITMTGSMNLTDGGYLVDGVDVLDSSIAFAIALG